MLPALAEQVLGYIRAHPGCRLGDISDGLGISHMRITYPINILERQDFITRKRSGPGQSQQHYARLITIGWGSCPQWILDKLDKVRLMRVKDRTGVVVVINWERTER